MTLLLGIDVGTTRTKLVLWDRDDERILCTVSTVTPVIASTEGDSRDPDAVWTAIVLLFDELSSQIPYLDQVSGVSAASVGEEIVFVDEKGRSIGPIATWYAAHPPASAVSDRPSNRIASWYALRARSLDSLPGATGFTDLGSYVLMRFAALTHAFTDPTHASRMGLLRDDVLEWSSARLASCGIAHLEPPQIIPCGHQVGTLSAEMAGLTGLPVGVPVRAGAHDHIAAAHAAGVREAGQAFISSGTSETQLVLTSAPWHELSSSKRPGVDYGASVDNELRYLHVSHPAGRRVAAICANDPLGRSVAKLYQSLDAMLDDSGLRIRPDAPPKDGAVRELFTELKQQAVVAADTYLELAQLGQTESGGVTVTGVPTTQHSWRRIRAHFAPTALTFSDVPEASGVGAALLAAGPISAPPRTDLHTQQNGAS